MAVPEEDYERLCQALLQELWNRKRHRWDRRLDAGGQEALLDELQHRTWAHSHERALDGRILGASPNTCDI